MTKYLLMFVALQAVANTKMWASGCSCGCSLPSPPPAPCSYPAPSPAPCSYGSLPALPPQPYSYNYAAMAPPSQPIFTPLPALYRELGIRPVCEKPALLKTLSLLPCLNKPLFKSPVCVSKYSVITKQLGSPKLAFGGGYGCGCGCGY